MILFSFSLHYFCCKVVGIVNCLHIPFSSHSFWNWCNKHSWLLGSGPWKSWHDVIDKDSFTKFIYLCFLVSLYYLIGFNWLFEHTYPHYLHCTWLRCLKSCTEDLSYGFLVKWLVVHSWFIDLGNPFEIVVQYHLIGGRTCLGY